MLDAMTLIGVVLLCGMVVWCFVWWSRRGQRKIAEETAKGWDEAGRKH